MMSLSSKVIAALNGKTLVTAESCTGGGIGAALTAVPGSSAVFKGGIICYTNPVKEEVLGVDREVLDRYGAVSQPVAALMASGVRGLLKGDIAVSVTGLAGPDGDDFGNPVGLVYIGYCNACKSEVRRYRFAGDREAIRKQAIEAALTMILELHE